MAARRPEGPPPPPIVQRLRLRYAKRGRLRFASHRDIARAMERAVRAGRVPIAFSAGFSPHPKLSWIGAAPTGTASEAEYLELGLSAACEPDAVVAAINAALPDGLAVLECVASGPGSLADRMQASVWRLELDGVAPGEADAAVRALLGASDVVVQRRTKDAVRSIDVRAALVSLQAEPQGPATGASPPGPVGPAPACATLTTVVRHATPAVRPDDVLTALRTVAALELASPLRATRLAQGPLDADGQVTDPLDPDRVAAALVAPDAPEPAPAGSVTVEA